MLQIKDIHKKYTIGEYVQSALDGVSLNLRDNEFVAILGPSGSGKTTLLNIIGGLDRYDSGDLIINNISTKNYKDKDWDSYRNHTIGFVFQSYNLIAHQTVLTNVELALTISGISKAERRKKAIDALNQVGLSDHIHKKPNQMSGGQMQRVAIARALVNNPDILLADEPTGALDTDTSVQIMELLKEVAKDRLVVMVTHNPELAEEYANRIVKLRDGKITDDSNPFTPEKDNAVIEHKNMGKSSMSFLTSLSLSFNNLKTKKARTLLTSFAGSIGIIGIALILALSSGVNIYIADIQKETMSSYPIQIDAQTFDLESMMGDNTAMPPMGGMGKKDKDPEKSNRTGVYADNTFLEVKNTMQSSIIENDLTNFKKYLDDPDSEIHEYLGDNGIVYTYDVKFDVYTEDSDGNVINTNKDFEEAIDSLQVNPMYAMMGMSSDNNGAENFTELASGKDKQGVSAVISDNYDVVYGSWPKEYNEVVLLLDENNSIRVDILAQLGIITEDEYNDIQKDIEENDKVEPLNWDYDDILSKTFSLVPFCDYYKETDNGSFKYILDDEKTTTEELLENAIELNIVGVIKPKDDAKNTSIFQNVAYSTALTDYIIDYTSKSAVVVAQKESEDINVLTGYSFKEPDTATQVQTTIDYLSNLSVSEKASTYTVLMSLSQQGAEQGSQTPPTGMPSGAMTGGMGMTGGTSEEMLAQGLDAWLANSPDEEVLLKIYEQSLAQNTYKDNLTDFGNISYDAPTSISLYTDNFENKDFISTAITNYNKTVAEDEEITYTDYVALLTSSITSIIDVISYVLISFVSVSLIVSCIMIGIITHISVMERTKEIGILRAIGASKKNISQVFNAETLIIGLCAGTIGVVTSGLLTIPINAVIHALLDDTSVNAVLPINSAIILVIISVVITVIAGLLPAKNAAKKDPVIALRSE